MPCYSGFKQLYTNNTNDYIEIPWNSNGVAGDVWIGAYNQTLESSTAAVYATTILVYFNNNTYAIDNQSSSGTNSVTIIIYGASTTSGYIRFGVFSTTSQLVNVFYMLSTTT